MVKNEEILVRFAHSLGLQPKNALSRQCEEVSKSPPKKLPNWSRKRSKNAAFSQMSVRTSVALSFWTKKMRSLIVISVRKIIFGWVGKIAATCWFCVLWQLFSVKQMLSLVVISVKKRSFLRARSYFWSKKIQSSWSVLLFFIYYFW